MHDDYPSARLNARAASSLWLFAGLILLFNALLVAWLVMRPASHAVIVAADNVAQFAGPLLALPLCFVTVRGRPRRATLHAAGTGGQVHRRSPLFLGLGVLFIALGQITYTIYEQILHYPVAPFPSWADAVFLAVYPFVLVGILLLPARALSAATRTRVALDGLMIMTAAVTFSWYFILGPTILQGSATVLGEVVSAAYPICDLILVLCLLLLSSRSSEAAQQRSVRILSLSLCIIVATDTVFGYEQLHGAYATGSLLDVGWPLGYMLVALAAQALRQSTISAHHPQTARAAQAGAASDTRSLWRSFLPYAFVPAVGGLLVYDWNAHGAAPLRLGVVIGGTLLLGLVLLRQVLAILENRWLYGRLNDAYHDTVAYAERTRALNDELHQTQQELEANNTALVEANVRLEALATTDPLTGLPNHRAMIAALDQELERGRRYHHPCSILFFDLDHFKALNDGYGHPVGDAALRDLAFVVRASLRGIDVLGRWGGEEFLVILSEADLAMALVAGERVRAAVAAHAFAAGGGAHLTCSVGVASYPHTADGRDGLIAAADHAMYAAKRLGRNQVRAADDLAVVALDGATVQDSSREDAALIGTVEALAALVSARDQYTGTHMQSVAALGEHLALALGHSATEARMVGLLGKLHDVGKVAVPDTVLCKPGRLTDEEWALMRRHPATGAEVVGHVPALRVLAPAIRAHHERWDGQGYPDGLAAESIPLGARIVAVAGAYGAMTSERPYRTACTPAQAVAELRRCTGTQFDPAVVAALERVLAVDGVAPDHDAAA